MLTLASLETPSGYLFFAINNYRLSKFCVKVVVYWWPKLCEAYKLVPEVDVASTELVVCGWVDEWRRCYFSSCDCSETAKCPATLASTGMEHTATRTGWAFSSESTQLCCFFLNPHISLWPPHLWQFFVFKFIYSFICIFRSESFGSPGVKYAGWVSDWVFDYAFFATP